MALLRAREAVMRQLRPALRAHGLTEQQWRVLSQLVTAEQMAASELAAATCLRASSLSRIIKDLETRGYLSRRAHMEDLRRTLVSITSRGRGMMQAIAPTAATVYEDIGNRFGDDRLEMMIDLSVNLVASLVGPDGLTGEPEED